MSISFDLGFARGTTTIITEISATRWLEIFRNWLHTECLDSVEGARAEYGEQFLMDLFGEEFGADAKEIVRKQLMWS